MSTSLKLYIQCALLLIIANIWLVAAIITGHGWAELVFWLHLIMSLAAYIHHCIEESSNEQG